MPFMVPEVIRDTWYVVETNQGDFIIPSDVCKSKGSELRKYFPERIGENAKITGFAIKQGLGARLSAPGYMDSTEWQGLYETFKEALKDLCETFSLCHVCYEDENECACETEPSSPAPVSPSPSPLYRNMAHLREVSKENGLHWFSSGAMFFFRSKLGKRLFYGRYFISSEQASPEHPRLYSIRRAGEGGSISTIGTFQGFRTSRQANAWAEKAGRSEMYGTIEQTIEIHNRIQLITQQGNPYRNGPVQILCTCDFCESENAKGGDAK